MKHDKIDAFCQPHEDRMVDHRDPLSRPCTSQGEACVSRLAATAYITRDLWCSLLNMSFYDLSERNYCAGLERSQSRGISPVIS